MSNIKVKCPSCKFLWEMTTPIRVSRTNQQNKYYWGQVVDIPAREIGYLPEEMHEAYKMLFLKVHNQGRPDTIRSTASLNTQEFSEYVEKCRMWAAKEGFNIPSPEEVFHE